MDTATADKEKRVIGEVFPIDRVSIAALARELGIHPATVYRWREQGLNGHRLETFQIGAKVFVSREALARWRAATSGASAGGPPSTSTPAARGRERRRAKAAAPRDHRGPWDRGQPATAASLDGDRRRPLPPPMR